MLSFHLAQLYGVETRVLVQAVKRNLERFPQDFMFQLTSEEWHNLKSQIVISSWGGMRRSNPYAFTEHGAVMLASVLNSPRAVRMSIYVVRAFVKLRQMLTSYEKIAKKIEVLEGEISEHRREIINIWQAIRQLMEPPEEPKRKIGFVPER